MKKATIKITDENGRCRTVGFEAPKRLSELMSQNGIPVDMPCGGRKQCLKCKIKITGDILPMDNHEASLLTEREIAGNIRFACMTMVVGDAQLQLFKPAYEKIRILTEGNIPDFALSPWGEKYGIAADIGTTTVAMYLYRLSDGILLKSLSDVNPQVLFGADVVSRIEKSMSGYGSQLARAIRGRLSELAAELCAISKIKAEDVDSIVLTGNTAMLYLLCGLNPQSIAAAPFEPEYRFGKFIPAGELDLPFDAVVYLPRCISAYVGADITTAILAAGFFRDGRVTEGKPRLLADIGTNGEIVLAANGRLLCCSTAAGPAFEGAGIAFGMSAKDGAISRVMLEDGAMTCTVLGGGEARGICGSGLLDATACMVESRVLDETGIISDEGHDFLKYVTKHDGQAAFRLPGTEVLLTQKDIRAVQLAKSAVRAGMLTLIEEAGLEPEDISELLIAGGFGSNINAYSAQRIGLIPDGFAARARTIGNAAGAGAAMVLMSDIIRKESETLCKYAQTVELSSNPVFFEYFISGMLFEQ